MEKRTEIKFETVKVTVFEATIQRSSGLVTTIVRETLPVLQSAVNIFLQDGYKVLKVEEVERDQVKLS